MSGNVGNWTTLVLLATTLALLGITGCFPAVDELRAQAALPQVLDVAVTDAADAPWPISDAPRSPRFVLRLEQALPERRSKNPPLHLVRGLVSDDVLDDLENPPLRAATLALLEPLTIAAHGHSVTATPQAPALPVGQVFTLVWATSPAKTFSIRISQHPAAGAQWVESFPAAGTRSVPTNTRHALLRFDGYLADLPEASLQASPSAPQQVEVASMPCPELGFGEGDCLWLSWQEDLVPRAEYTLHFTSAFRDLAGNAVDVPPLHFEAAEAPDLTPPRRMALPCARDELTLQGLCALASDSSLSVRAMFDEPAMVELIAPPQRSSSVSFTDAVTATLFGLTSHHCSLLRATDLAGNQLDTPICLALPEGLARVTIDEVLVNPLGPDPAQEFVELLNFGDTPVPLDGFTLTQDAFSEGQRLDLSGALMPGERVLVVAPTFDRRSSADAQVPDAVRLVRLAKALSLPNGGASLFLRDAQGRRLSASPRVKPAREGQSLARYPGSALRSGLASDFLLDPNGGSTPGRPTFNAGEMPP